MTAAEAFDRARLLAARGDPQGALRAIDEVLRAEPGHLGALLLEAQLHLDDRDGEEALRLYERAVGMAPRSSEAWNALARCRHALGHDDVALQAAETARSLLGEGDNARQVAPVYLTLVWCLREKRLFREALDVAEEGLARIPDAILAQWAATVEEELAEAEKEGC
ncbi:MAG TPA: tetratricopeptide repeat protein [Candidatus Thermoplasmatota archaeon]